KGPAALDAKYQETKTAVIEERWHWSYYPVAQAFWELIKRHWQDEEVAVDEAGQVLLDKDGKPQQRKRIPYHYQQECTRLLKSEMHSWILPNLELLHSAINTEIEGVGQ
ncbi:MAG: hypothetical protein RBU37_23850, partial [Myxococcota bacterium]|nr:hypothetical protein [Myxococcota bacterium]